jgi:hypothetical protein
MGKAIGHAVDDDLDCTASPEADIPGAMVARLREAQHRRKHLESGTVAFIDGKFDEFGSADRRWRHRGRTESRVSAAARAFICQANRSFAPLCELKN